MMENFIIMLLLGSVAAYEDSYIQPVNIFYVKPSFEETPSQKLNYQDKPPQNIHLNMTCGDLGIDKTCVVVKSNVDYEIRFLYQSMECEKCSLIVTKPLKAYHSDKFTLGPASLGTVWEVVNEENNSICGPESIHLGENSWYQLNVNKSGCSLICDKEPEFIFFPILIAVGIYLLLAAVCLLGSYLKRKEVLNNIFRHNSLDDLAAAYSSSSTSEDSKQKTQKRLRSLDTVRGIAIVIMIFVNYGGGKYWFFHHSHWNGLTVADLVFPWFIWMMGMSMALSMRSQLRKSVPKKKIFLKIIKRSIILFALGIMLNTLCQRVDLHKLRIPGVLQRFSISYFVVATVHLLHASAEDTSQVSLFKDIKPYVGEWFIMIIFLTAHILITFLVHSPDCPSGYLGPGGLQDGGQFSDCTGGAAGYIDRLILGESHIYHNPSVKKIYQNELSHDPEGILGYLTSIFLVFLGLQAGKVLLAYKESKARTSRWILWACATGAVAAALCKCSKNDGIIPVNKNLWSVSFILATGSMAFLLIAICYFVIDVKKWWTGAPFFYAGMNAILLYIGHSITHQMFPWSWEVDSTHLSELFMNLWGTTIWVIISIRLYYKNVFLII